MRCPVAGHALGDTIREFGAEGCRGLGDCLLAVGCRDTTAPAVAPKLKTDLALDRPHPESGEEQGRHEGEDEQAAEEGAGHGARIGAERARRIGWRWQRADQRATSAFSRIFWTEGSRWAMARQSMLKACSGQGIGRRMSSHNTTRTSSERFAASWT